MTYLQGHVESCSLQEAMLAMALALYADKDTLQKLRAAGTITVVYLQTTVCFIKCVC